MHRYINRYIDRESGWLLLEHSFMHQLQGDGCWSSRVYSWVRLMSGVYILLLLITPSYLERSLQQGAAGSLHVLCRKYGFFSKSTCRASGGT